jgi:hypothetical protein
MPRRFALLLAVLALTGCAQFGQEKCSLDGRCARAPSAYATPAALSPSVAAADTQSR